MVYAYNRILISHKKWKEAQLYVITWMSTGNVRPSERSQT